MNEIKAEGAIFWLVKAFPEQAAWNPLIRPTPPWRLCQTACMAIGRLRMGLIALSSSTALGAPSMPSSGHLRICIAYSATSNSSMRRLNTLTDMGDMAQAPVSDLKHTANRCILLVQKFESGFVAPSKAKGEASPHLFWAKN